MKQPSATTTALFFLTDLPERIKRDRQAMTEMAQRLQQQNSISRPEMFVLAGPVLNECDQLQQAGLDLLYQVTDILPEPAALKRSVFKGDRQRFTAHVQQRAEALKGQASALERTLTINTRLVCREPVVAMQLALMRSFLQQLDLAATQALITAS